MDYKIFGKEDEAFQLEYFSLYQYTVFISLHIGQLIVVSCTSFEFFLSWEYSLYVSSGATVQNLACSMLHLLHCSLLVRV